MMEYLGGAIKQDPHGDEGTWAPEIWDKIIEDYKIKSIADIGCGYGYSTRYFHEKGLDVVGVEGDKYAVRDTVFTGNLILNDYTKGFALKDKVDLVWSCEFVEHVEEEFIYNFLKDFRKGQYIAMTHAVPGQQGYHHVNCRDASYWIEKLEQGGYRYNEEYTYELRAIVHDLKHGQYLKTLLFFEKELEL